MIKLRELRKSSDLTIAKTAENLNLPFETYRSYETEKNQADYDTLIRMANYFGVSVDYLLGREAQKNNLMVYDNHEITDKQTIDFLKLYEVMTELQKAQVFGYIVALLEIAGVNVKAVLGH